MGKVFIVHFQPLEKYPPVMNLIRYMTRVSSGSTEIHVVSTEGEEGKQLFGADGVVIHRLGKFSRTWTRLQRLKFYLQFNFKGLALLLKYKPGKVLYYETLSGGPPGLYRSFFNKDCQLFIHYHEYTSPEEYRHGMFVNRWLHALEKRQYKHARWVSHTNEYRGKLFARDLGPFSPARVNVLPNYPPESWRRSVPPLQERAAQGRIRFVYVGALSLDTMFVETFATFIKQHPDNYTWDIFSDNFSPDVVQFFDNLNASNIFFRGGIAYDKLPETLSEFDIGVILYKGHIPNYVYNAPNKLFEYLSCGLDVWFPIEMTGSKPYTTTGTYPEVLEVNFNRLASVDALPKKYHSSYRLKEQAYFCEDVYSNLVGWLLERN